MSYPPRILPLPADQRDESTRELLSAAGPFAEHNIFTTMVRHPRLYRQWLPYGTAMLYAKLPARDRELLILRTANRCQCDYEWIQHKEIALGIGVTEDEIERICTNSVDDGWTAFDAALIRAVDELLDDHLISDATWQTLAGRYDEVFLIEVPMVVGHYFALGMTLNSLGVQLGP